MTTLEVIKKGEQKMEIENNKMLTYVFPGQGVQSVGMGAELFNKYNEYIQQADEILECSIKQLCLEDPDNCLSNTKYTQPAIYTVSALLYLEKIERTGIKPNFVAGYSLGEYSIMANAKSVFKEGGALRFIELNVSGAFHSRYMEEARKNFEEYIKGFEYKTPQIVAYSNVTAKPHIASEIKEKLGKQMVSSVRWHEIISGLLNYPENQIIEIGPGRGLAGLTKKIQREVRKMRGSSI